MTFTSSSYFIFLPLVFLGCYVVSARLRIPLLLLASLVFYGTLGEPKLLMALVGVALLTYVVGILLDDDIGVCRRRVLIGVGVVGNLLVLVTVKYLPVMTGNATVSGDTSPVVRGIVAVGVSYYVFQAISYLVDIYRARQEPEREFGLFMLSLAFFPKLLQGPIERAADLLPQLRRPFTLSPDAVRAGAFLVGLGLFKKLVIADRLAPVVDLVYDTPSVFSGLHFVLATYLYAIQIYLDFSGYTDIALGSARLFNIRLTQNFNRPYRATSVADFWRRWHISFSRWILDYLFRPLQAALREFGNAGTAVALLVTFAICGVWHGVGWGFLVWGLLHGSYLTASTYYRPLQKRIHRLFGPGQSRLLIFWRRMVTFNLVSFAFIFFRSRSLDDATQIVSHLFSGIPALVSGVFQRFPDWSASAIFVKTVLKPLFMRQGGGEMAIALSALMLLALFNRLYYRHATVEELLSVLPSWQRWGVYHLLAGSVIFFGASNQGMGFIYYQF